MAQEGSTDNTENGGNGDGETKSSASRYWLTNDVLAGLLIITLALSALADLSPWVNSPDVLMQAFIAYTGVAVVWAFGKGAAKLLMNNGS